MYFFPRQEKKPFVPPNSVLLNNNNPFDEYDIRQQQQIKKQEMEKEKFMNEIKEFEERHNPYEILNIPRTANKSEVTKAYKKLSLYHHPDKGGKEELFNILTKAYNTIIKRIEFNKAKKKIEHDDLKKGAKSYYKKLDVNQKQDFDINKFNRTFSENKISDVNDKGYGDYSLLIIQKIRFANIMEKFYSKKTSKNSNISDCYVNTYDIEYVNKYLSKTNGRIKKLKSSTIDKIKELEDDK